MIMLEVLIIVISLFISSIFSWKIAQLFVSLAIGLFEFLIITIVINTVFFHFLNSFGIFNIYGLIIGAIVGTLYGIFSEALKIEQQ